MSCREECPHSAYLPSRWQDGAENLGMETVVSIPRLSAVYAFVLKETRFPSFKTVPSRDI